MMKRYLSLFLVTALFGYAFVSVPLRAQEELAEPEVVVEMTAADGDAADLADTDVSATSALIEKLKESGKTGIALFFISVVGFSFAFERLFNLRKSAITPTGLAGEADKLWSQADLDGVNQLSAQSKSTLGRAIIEIVEHRDSPRADITTMASDLASREMRLHLQRAYPLAVVATISPLLGLFGTVYGMIGAFESVALAGEMGDPSIMAGDIAYALITTALGLVIHTTFSASAPICWRSDWNRNWGTL